MSTCANVCIMTKYRYFLFDTGAPARVRLDANGDYEAAEVWRDGDLVAASGLIPKLLITTGATEISEARFNALTERRGRGGA